MTLAEGNQETVNTSSSTPETIVEAQGWVINSDGQVELVAYLPGGSMSGQSSSCDLR
ncbi:hypothetical protein [Fortiea contorta]|uniref:hypothetical protein n=1 Tax=Fortiea contorta TaxID=1892405 RepID=UPI000346249B|nr:hypothetical protein [Fortiea contorta]